MLWEKEWVSSSYTNMIISSIYYKRKKQGPEEHVCMLHFLYKREGEYIIHVCICVYIYIYIHINFLIGA